MFRTNETVRRVVATAKVVGMPNVEIVITHVRTGEAETYMVQAVSPTRSSDKVFCENEVSARTAANGLWTLLRKSGEMTLVNARSHTDVLRGRMSTVTPMTEGETWRLDQINGSGTDVPAPTTTDVPAPTTVTAPATQDVAAGRYAIERDGELRFYVVDHGKPGTRWEGYTFVKVQASDDTWPVRNHAERKAVLALIAEDPKAAMIRYGREIGQCGVCSRVLTDVVSREFGLGPVCREKMGW